MRPTSKYEIVLQQGKALKSFFEMTEEERMNIAKRVFEKVSKLAAQFGSRPVTSDTVTSRSHNTNS